MVVRCGLKILWLKFATNNHYRIFFLHTFPSTTVFKLGYVLFYQFYGEISIFSIKKCLVRLQPMTSWHHAGGRLTPPGIRRKYPERVKIAENLVGHARTSDHFQAKIGRVNKNIFFVENLPEIYFEVIIPFEIRQQITIIYQPLTGILQKWTTTSPFAILFAYMYIKNWVVRWQNQQNGCAPSKTQISLGICPVWS